MKYLEDHLQAGQSNQLGMFCCCSFVFKMLKCIELDERLKAMDQEITVNPQFVQKVIDLTFCHNIQEIEWNEYVVLNVCIYSASNYTLV